jgi:phosphoglycerol transferase
MGATFYIYLSLSLFVVSVYLFRKTGSTTKNILFYTTVIISVSCYLIYGISDYFTGNGIDESIIFHLKYGLRGAGFAEYSDLIFTSIVVIILSSMLLRWLLVREGKNNSHWIFRKNISYFLVLLSLLLNPAISDVYTLLSDRPGIVHAKRIHKEPYTKQPSTMEFAESYLEPFIAKLTNKTKNLVVIYAEGLERTFLDKTIFPGLITGLRKLESKSTYFTNIKQVPATGWTIGGMVASQCGIPLFTPSHGNSMAGIDLFLPSAICLGDLLHAEGYDLVYYGGADLAFAGKGKFYSTHKFDHIAGKDELLPALEDKSYITGWGLYDDSLFDLAYERFIELSDRGGKFGLFLLTLDTHHPKGHPSKSCQDKIYKDGSNAFLNAVACSDYLITEFVHRIMQSPYGEKTVVVVLSDHLAMRNSASHLLQKRERKNLFMIIEANVNRSTRIQKLGSTLDIAPTILPFIGYRGAIGLGRDLTDANQPISEIEHIQTNLLSWKPFISDFWDFPRIREFVEVDVTENTLKIDDRKFNIPVFVELTSDLQTTLKFQFDASKGQKKLIHHLLSLNENKPFLLIDHCANLNILDESLGQTGFCLITGERDKYIKKIKLYGKVKFTCDDIREFTGIVANFRTLRVAHAGGAINGKTYTNSLEALDYNVKNGFLYFELDFSFTQDRRLVCIHDWKQHFKSTFGFLPKEKPTLEVFESLVKNKSELNQCTLETLANWMKQNTYAFIITDIKEDNLHGLKLISEYIPEFETRIIPQIYNPNNYNKVKRMGYKQIIWTLYDYKGSNDDVLGWSDKFNGPFAITMPKGRAVSDLPRKLADKHIPTYVHTINTLEQMNEFINDFGITEIYTDFLRSES